MEGQCNDLEKPFLLLELLHEMVKSSVRIGFWVGRADGPEAGDHRFPCASRFAYPVLIAFFWNFGGLPLLIEIG